MKIKINQYESYNIDFPDEIGAQEFFAMKGRIDNIARLIGKDPLLQTAQDAPMTEFKQTKVHAPIEQRPWDASREEGLKFIKCQYFGTQIERAEYEKISQRTWGDISKRVSSCKIKWNIQPKEVGMIRFPTIWEARKRLINTLKIQNETETEIQEEKQEAPTL